MFKKLRFLFTLAMVIPCSAAAYSGAYEINYYLAVVMGMAVAFGGLVLCLYQMAE